MKPFSYEKITDSTAHAIQSASGGTHSAFIGGGTNLIDLMREFIMQPEHLVDVSDLGSGTVSRQADGSVLIGAAARNSAVANDPIIRQQYPVLSRALLSGASAQLRNMATVAGNLMQRTRCYYFYDRNSACNKRNPGSGCDAIHGYNRMNAVLGGSPDCIAVNPSDMSVALACLDAVVHVHGINGERKIPILDFHRLPGKTPQIETDLQDHELITAVELPARGFSDHWCYLKIRDRASYAFALVSVAAALEIRGGKIAAARLALGGVGTKPWRDPDSERALVGRNPDEAAFRSAADIFMRPAKGYEHNEFKIELAKRAIVRGLKLASGERG